MQIEVTPENGSVLFTAALLQSVTIKALHADFLQTSFVLAA
jgi:hypothetical protein